MKADARTPLQTERASFEAYMTTQYSTARSPVRAPDGYIGAVAHPCLPMTYASTQMLWEAWQARATLERKETT